MKPSVSITIIAFAALVVACGESEGEGLRLGNPTGSPAAPAPVPGSSASSTNAPGAPAPQCPAGIPAAKQIATNPNVADLTIVGEHVFYRSLSKVMKVGKDGSAPTVVFDEADVVRSYVDAAAVVFIDSPEPPDAVLRILPFDDKGAVSDATAITIATNANAGGTSVFGADTENLYLLADEPNAQVVYALGKTKDRTLSEVVRITDGVVSHPQIAGGALWYVKDQQRVFRMVLADPAAEIAAGEPKEIFGFGYSSCGLAVGAGKVFCATGTMLEQRELDGANPKAVLQRVDAAMFAAGALVVRTDFTQQNETMKRVLRSLKTTPAGVEEKIVACGRDSLSDVAVDATSIAWLEPGKGVFITAR